jgi:hypothetical protein
MVSQPDGLPAIAMTRWDFSEPHSVITKFGSGPACHLLVMSRVYSRVGLAVWITEQPQGMISENYDVLGDIITPINKNPRMTSPNGAKWMEITHTRPNVVSACSSQSSIRWLEKHEPLYPSKASRSDFYHFDTFDLGSR